MNTELCRIGIIGARGRMGSMLAERWAAAGCRICGVDLPLDDEKLRDAASGSAAVVLCVPAGVLREVLERLRPFLSDQVLMDITSVKMQPLDQMEAAYSGPVVGTHPLFGPQPRPGDTLRVCICPGRTATEESIRLVERLFAGMGCETFRASAEEHDRAAAAIQGLNFVTSLAYFAACARREDILPYLTPSFRRHLDASRKMLTEDAALFEWLFEANPLSQEAVRRYRSFLNVAAGGDINLLVEQARWWWDQK